MLSSIYNTGDFVRVIDVGDTLPTDLIGQIFTVISKNWNILVLRPHNKDSDFLLHLDDSAVRMWKSKRVQRIEKQMSNLGIPQKQV